MRSLCIVLAVAIVPTVMAGEPGPQLKPLATLAGASPREQTPVAFSPDGSRLVVGTLRGIKVWDVKNGERLVAVSRPPASVWSVAFNAEGKTLASAGTKGVLSRRGGRGEGDPTLKLWEWVPAKMSDK